LVYDSNQIDAKWYLALSHKELGNEKEAISFYDQVVSLNPDYEYLWSIDKNRLQLKKFVEENWMYTLMLIFLLLASLFFVRKIVKNNRPTEID
jgi:tetratricopeptide (TPR) repeat protein